MKSRIQLPVYNDGVAKIYRICEDDDIQATKYLKYTGMCVCYCELSISDKLRSSIEANRYYFKNKTSVYEEIN